MEKISRKDIEWLTQPAKEFDFTGSIRPEKKLRPSKNTLRKRLIKVSLWGLLIATLGIMPFFLLIRTAVYLNVQQELNGWLALTGGMIISTFLLAFYVFFLFRKVEKKKLVVQYGLGGVGALVGGFCIYALLYLSSVNAKSSEVREVYRSLHPILRVAVATTTLADNEIVITDIQRSREDYLSWGLTPLESSMHYEQEDGFVHAIDLRTIGHSEFRNFVLEYSLKAMGFQTIRHVGTADHLHIALKNYNQ